MKEKTGLFLITILLFSPLISADPQGSSTQTCQQCQIEKQDLRDNITDLKSNISDLKTKLKYYKNQTDYYQNRSQFYRQQYLSSDANLTNRRVKEIYENITRIKQVINDNRDKIMKIDQEFDTIFNLTDKDVLLGLSIGGIFGGLIGSLFTIELALGGVWSRLKERVSALRKKVFSNENKGEETS